MEKKVSFDVFVLILLSLKLTHLHIALHEASGLENLLLHLGGATEDLSIPFGLLLLIV